MYCFILKYNLSKELSDLLRRSFYLAIQSTHNNEVKIYDSLYSTIDDETLKLIQKLLGPAFHIIKASLES